MKVRDLATAPGRLGHASEKMPSQEADGSSPDFAYQPRSRVLIEIPLIGHIHPALQYEGSHSIDSDSACHSGDNL